MCIHGDYEPTQQDVDHAKDVLSRAKKAAAKKKPVKKAAKKVAKRIQSRRRVLAASF